MKKIIVALLTVAMAVGCIGPVYASDWDKAGMILTGMEGLRIITRGKLDPVGSMFGINNSKGNYKYKSHQRHSKYKKHSKNHRYVSSYNCIEKVWVPHYRWKKEYIPKHEEHRKGYGKVYVSGHYIKYKAENGGHWETQNTCY